MQFWQYLKNADGKWGTKKLNSIGCVPDYDLLSPTDPLPLFLPCDFCHQCWVSCRQREAVLVLLAWSGQRKTKFYCTLPISLRRLCHRNLICTFTQTIVSHIKYALSCSFFILSDPDLIMSVTGWVTDWLMNLLNDLNLAYLYTKV